MLMPKKVEYRKANARPPQRQSCRAVIWRSRVRLEGHGKRVVTDRQIEASRVAITRFITLAAKIVIRNSSGQAVHPEGRPKLAWAGKGAP